MNETIQLIDAIAWPMVVLLLVLGFRRPLRSFMNDLKEISGFGVSAKRGDKEADLLLERIEEDSPTDVRPDTSRTDGFGLKSTILRFEVEQFSFLIADHRLEHLHKELRESRVDQDACRLIAVWAYDEVLVYIRVVELVRQLGPMKQGVPLFSGPFAYRQAQKMGAPMGLVRDLRELKDFKKKLESGELTVTPEGAATFVRACRNTLTQLYGWRTGASVAERSVFERATDTTEAAPGDAIPQGRGCLS
ncbi:MAG: hypothetical protein ACRCYU_15140 [Nocardioides sp.]